MGNEKTGVMLEYMIDGQQDSNAPETEDIVACIQRWREDAERYRWLRDQQMFGCWPQVVDGLHRLGGDELDMAVDSAKHTHGVALPSAAVGLNLH